MSSKAKNYKMFKFVVFLFLSGNALSLELGETPAEEREIEGELLKFKADKVTETSSKVTEDQQTYEKVSKGEFW